MSSVVEGMSVLITSSCVCESSTVKVLTLCLCIPPRHNTGRLLTAASDQYAKLLAGEHSLPSEAV